MNGPVITPVALPATASRHDTGSGFTPRATGRSLPLASVPIPRTNATVYGLAIVDQRGRVADRPVLRALGWAPSARLDIHETRGLLLIRANTHGVFHVTAQGHLHLPASIRRCCGLISGDRVLLAADPERGVLVVHPPAVLDDLLAPCHAELPDGEAV